jgi:small subunit ribosomal protein S16
MLAIRMQRTGRKGHAMFRVVVQDARRTPTSGKIVARLGSYDPHAKSLTLDKEKASFYLEHGAQPSDRMVLLLKKEGVKLPNWVSLPDKKDQAVRNPAKRRSTRPDEPEAPAETPAEPEKPAESEEVEKPAEEAAPEAEAEAETPAEEPKAEEEKPAESTEEAEPAKEAGDEKSAE